MMKNCEANGKKVASSQKGFRFLTVYDVEIVKILKVFFLSKWAMNVHNHRLNSRVFQEIYRIIFEGGKGKNWQHK